jgi:hypothetical protein
MRKSSSLQFHIELTDSDDVMKSAAHHRHQLPPATAIAALSEPLDTLEESLAAQVRPLVVDGKAAAHATHPCAVLVATHMGMGVPCGCMCGLARTIA